MATINSVQKSIHLPLSGLASPRVLMCSASVGTEGSVTLQLRDANSSSDSNQSPAPTSLHNALTIGYPDPEMLADVLGTLQTASLKNTTTTATTSTRINSISTTNSNNPSNSNNNNNNSSSNSSSSNNNNNNNIINNINNKITISRRNSSVLNKESNNNSNNNNSSSNKSSVHTVSTSTNTTNKTNSYIKNCLIRSSSCSNTTNVTSLAQIMSNSSTSSSALLNNNTNSNSNCSSNSNFSTSSSSNDSTNSVNSNSNHSSSNQLKCIGNKNVNGATNSTNILKKSRPKLSSPTRHGPQQCQICSKIFGNASALAKHKLTHSDERKYVCAMCSKAFKRQDHLNGHMMTHRNKKPYECKAEGCGKSYCDARSLRRHTENHHSGIITPQHQTLSPTAGTPTGLSLSPATASGDASSPDGATCIRTYISTGGTVVDAATGVALTEEQIKAINLPIKTGVALLSPTSCSSTSSGGASISSASPTIALTETNSIESEGLTREQLDLISKIMQQTKQTSAQVTVSSPTSVNSYKVDTGTVPVQTTNSHSTMTSRPRTWNMQLLNSSQNVSITVDEATTDTTLSTTASAIDTKDDELNQQLVAAINPHLLNIVKIDQKPVECNLCHRKFKNIPALNGHMRLHGGYFKKDPDAKKNEKKEPSGPPLQTASIGVRALIEEKIISKRSKDLNKGAFVVPAPPGNVAASTTTSIRRSISDLDSFLNSKTHSSVSTSCSSSSPNTAATTMLPAATTIKSGGLSIQQIGLPQSIEIFSTKQQKTVNNVSVGVGTTSALPNSSTITPSTIKSTATTSNTTITKSTSTDPKDSTLIELLKRGTRIAVTSKKPHMNSTNTVHNNALTTATISAPRQIIANNNRTVIVPSDVQVVPTKLKTASNLNSNTASSTSSIPLTEGTPLSLTISQGGGGSGDVYTLTYTSDTAGLFEDAEVYNVCDTEMLLQTVDSMQLLNEATNQSKGEHSEQFTLGPGNSSGTDDLIKIESESNIGTDLNSVIHETVTTNPLPAFQQFHSKEILMQTSGQLQSSVATGLHTNNSLTLPAELKHQLASMTSPTHSPLAYPTPPSSYENVTQSSPYIEEGQQFVESANVFFNEKCNADFLKHTNENAFFRINTNDLSDNEKILKLKSVLEESAYDTTIKVEDLLASSQTDTECDLREFAETNLSFLDEDQEFLNDSHNATSPLSESFFTSGIGSTDEVKEVLREVLPEENVNLTCENPNENIIDLYYLPGLGLQSQMMPNSEDPLLSSSPRDFGQQRSQLQQVNQMPQQLQQQQQQQQQQNPNSQNLYTSQQHQQLQQQQLQQNELNFATGQIVLPLETGNNTCSTGSTSTQLQQMQMQQFNVQNLPQVQNQSNFVETSNMQNICNLEAAIMQPIIYAESGDKTGLQICTSQSQVDHTNAGPDSNIYFANNCGGTQLPVTPVTATHQMSNTHSSVAAIMPSPATVISTLQPLSNQTNSILKRRLRANGSNGGDGSSTPHTYSKYHALSPFRSKLRKPSRTHYTPAPILNPDRKGVGLYCNVRKELSTNLITFDTFDDDFDDPVGLVDFSDESKVNLGSAYQAQIPPCKFRDSICEILDTVDADQMWDPNVQTDEKILMRYIDLSKSSAVPLGSHSEEIALQTLYKADGNTAAAVLTLLQTNSSSFQMKWSAYELEVFLKGLERHGKNFGAIALELGTKTTGECVQMYYFWKKLCVDYKVSHLKTETVSVASNQIVEVKPYVCEVPDCSASFTSKAALHGHTRIHTYGRNANHANNQTTTINTSSSTACATPQSGTNHTANHTQKDPTNANCNANANANVKEGDFPCKVCGKVFNKVKSRSAHMKTHRVQETDMPLQQNQIHHQQQQQQQQPPPPSQQQ